MNRRILSITGFLLSIATVILLAGCSPSSAANSQTQGSSPLAVNLLGKTAQYSLDGQGRLTSSLQLTSADGTISVSLASGTSMLVNNSPATTLTISQDSRPPMLPDGANLLGWVYDIGPAGIRLNYPLQLTISYSQSDLALDAPDAPLSSLENSMYVASYQGNDWKELSYKRLDTTGHKITAAIDQSAKLAVLVPTTSNASTAGTAAPAPTPSTQAAPGAVKVVVAGYMHHGPLAPTVQAIKDVLAKYGNKVDVTWVDLGTKDGAAYFKANNITAHMNVIINGKVTYKVNGKDVTFQWFEGQQWTRQDLDTVLASLVSK